MRAAFTVLAVLLSSVVSADSTVVLSTGKHIRPFDLSAIDSPANNECLTYDSASNSFEWATCGVGGTWDGGDISAQGKAPTGCAAGTVGWSFTADTGAGVCLSAANDVRLGISTTDFVTVDVNQFQYTKAGTVVFNYAAGGLTLGSTAGTADWFVLTPQAAGAAGRYGELTTADLTANRTWTFPDAAGTVLVGQVSDTQIADGAVDGGTGGEIADNSITPADIDETQDYSFTTLSGKQDRNNSAVNDDDCTGEQGLWWYDTTDSAFEFCNANTGAPAALGGSFASPGLGFIVDVDGAGTLDNRSLSAGTGISISNPAGTAGDPVISTDAAVVLHHTSGTSTVSATGSVGNCYAETDANLFSCYTSTNTARTFVSRSDTVAALAASTSAELRGVLSDEYGAGIALFLDGSGNLDLGGTKTAFGSLAVISAQTGTASTTAAQSGYVITNTGDADGSTNNLMDNPTAGVNHSFAVTAAQTMTIAPAAGETLYLNAASCANITSATIGSAVSVVAVTGGSGGVWVASGAGFTCN